MNFERLHGWHNALFEYSQSKIHKIKRAKFRDDEMSVVSGSQENAQIHYEALPVERIEDEIFYSSVIEGERFKRSSLKDQAFAHR